MEKWQQQKANSKEALRQQRRENKERKKERQQYPPTEEEVLAAQIKKELQQFEEDRKKNLSEYVQQIKTANHWARFRLENDLNSARAQWDEKREELKQIHRHKQESIILKQKKENGQQANIADEVSQRTGELLQKLYNYRQEQDPDKKKILRKEIQLAYHPDKTPFDIENREREVQIRADLFKKIKF